MKDALDDLIELIGFSEEDPLILKKYAAQTAAWQEEVTQVFYDTLYGCHKTDAVFQEGERLAHQDTLRNWYKTVTEGVVEDESWRRQWFVQPTRIIAHDITNPLTFGKMSRVQQLFLAKCRENLPSAEAEALFGAFKRVTDIITCLIAKGWLQNYSQTIEGMSGQSQALFGRMDNMEFGEMLAQPQAI